MLHLCCHICLCYKEGVPCGSGDAECHNALSMSSAVRCCERLTKSVLKFQWVGRNKRSLWWYGSGVGAVGIDAPCSVRQGSVVVASHK